MQWSDINFRPTTRTLRQFSGLWLVFFAGLAGWRAYRDEYLTFALLFGVLAVTVGPLGLLRPQWVRWIYVGWMILAFPIGWTVSRVLLAMLYYGLITPIGLCFRLMGRDALALRPRPDLATYWSAKPAAVDLASYLKQH